MLMVQNGQFNLDDPIKTGNSSLSELTDEMLQICYNIPKVKNGAGQGEDSEC